MLLKTNNNKLSVYTCVCAYYFYTYMCVSSHTCMLWVCPPIAQIHKEDDTFRRQTAVGANTREPDETELDRTKR